MKIEHNFKGVTYIRIGCMQGLYAEWNQTAFELSENICKYMYNGKHCKKYFFSTESNNNLSYKISVKVNFSFIKNR